MTEEQADKIIQLLESIDSRLSYIESTTSNTESNTNEVSNILKYVKRIYDK